MRFIILLVVGFLWSMLVALLGMWVLHATNLPVLDTISYWQTFGICLFISMSAKGFNLEVK